MKTRIIKISARNPNKKIIAEAAAIIRGGGLVAFPTETVYGLGANALDKKAVRKFLRQKGGQLITRLLSILPIIEICIN